MNYNAIFQYNNVEKPFIEIKLYNETEAIYKGLLEINNAALKNGLPDYNALLNAIDKFLTSANIERQKVLFIINPNDLFKSTTIIPGTNERKTKKLYDIELGNKMPNFKELNSYSFIQSLSDSKIYYEYLINKNYDEYFNKLGNELGFSNVTVDNNFGYLYNNVVKEIKSNTFVYFYEEKNITTMFVVINGVVSGYNSFVSTDGNYRLNIMSIVDKHIHEFEKTSISKVITNKEVACLAYLNPEVREFEIGK